MKDNDGFIHTNIFDYFDIWGISYVINAEITSAEFSYEFLPMRPCTESDLSFMAEDKTKIKWDRLQREFSEYACVDQPEKIHF